MKLADKVKDALDEVRLLILGSQILVGFQFNAVFREGFDRLPAVAKLLDAVALLLMLGVVALLMFPPAWHRIVEEGRDSARLLRVVTRTLTLALVPFAVSIGLDLFIVLERVLGGMAAGLVGGASVLTALFFWFVLEFWRRRKVHRDVDDKPERDRVEDPGLPQKIVQMLTEARVVLPGAQALLGFQLSIILTDSFEKLSAPARLVHAASLCAMTLAVILLMAPAAYHRIVHEGNASGEFHRVGSLMVMAATLPLALGLCGDLYVVLVKIFQSDAVAGGAAAAAFAGFVALWYVVPAAQRRRREGRVSLLPRGSGYAR